MANFHVCKNSQKAANMLLTMIPFKHDINNTRFNVRRWMKHGSVPGTGPPEFTYVCLILIH